MPIKKEFIRGVSNVIVYPSMLAKEFSAGEPNGLAHD
jgi:hypothetical protein